MSTHNIPSNIDHDALLSALQVAIPSKRADSFYENGLNAPPTAIVYEDDLTTGEESTFADTVSVVQTEQISKAQIKTYLKQQLTKDTPDNAATIASTVQTYVNANQGVLNAIERIATLYGYDTQTNAGYLRTVYILLGIFG